MLLNIPHFIPPELLSTLCEMGHSDRIVLADANFPGASIAKKGNVKFIRMDGTNIPELLDAVLQLIPLDHCPAQPVLLMQKMESDAHLEIPIWDEYKKIVGKYAPQGENAVGHMDRFDFYDAAENVYCIVQTGESSIYANVMVQKGVVVENAESNC